MTQTCHSSKAAARKHFAIWAGLLHIAGRKEQIITICLRNILSAMPDSLRFLLIVLCLAGAGYGAVWGLANFPPEQQQVVKQLSNGVFEN
jgi:hypothetical protein